LEKEGLALHYNEDALQLNSENPLKYAENRVYHQLLRAAEDGKELIGCNLEDLSKHASFDPRTDLKNIPSSEIQAAYLEEIEEKMACVRGRVSSIGEFVKSNYYPSGAIPLCLIRGQKANLLFSDYRNNPNINSHTDHTGSLSREES
jgi:hypothetical protein